MLSNVISSVIKTTNVITVKICDKYQKEVKGLRFTRHNDTYRK